MQTHVIALIALLVLPQAGAAETTPESVLGVWSTPIAEQSAYPGGPSAFLRERLDFGPETNTLEIEAFVDGEALVPLFTYESIGPYRTVGPSETITGALNLETENDRATITIFQDAPDLWRALKLDTCPLEVGVPVDIAGCVSGPPLNSAQCVELDIINVDETGLRIGARDTDRCTTRPSALGETLYTKE